MDKFVIKKRRQEVCDEGEERDISGIISEKDLAIPTTSKSTSKKARKIAPTWIIIQVLDSSGVPRSYFEGLLSEQKQQSAMLSKKVKVADKAQEVSYFVAELVVKSMKPHTIAETLILPACSAIVKTMFGSEAEKEVRKIPVSDNTISRRIHDMSADIEETVCTSVKEIEMFALQVDESTDIGGMAQLLVFVRYMHDVKIVKQFFCCKELKETTTGNDIFTTLSEFLKSVGLTWQSCVGICTDGAPAMIGLIKGFVSLVERKQQCDNNTLLSSS
ncbi:zinc finger BED domain-containing protein 5-like [Palaemon carinicauda]|uniref:zinc finger BED domain-containing protein 5-like n=1 Tax=Palaemon carinicauda TaxID=392227 RepID=UPI0035B5A1D9